MKLGVPSSCHLVLINLGRLGNDKIVSIEDELC